MQRREFITLLGGTAAAWPLAGHAQQADQVRRIGVLTVATRDDLEIKARLAAFLHELQRLGWTEGRNVRIDLRGSAGDPVASRQQATELVALKPDVILAMGSLPVTSLLEATRTVPIVFTVVADPVGAGFVDSLARPRGNATGFMLFEYTLSAKWPELLKQVAPSVTRAAVLRDPIATAGIGQFAVVQALAPSVSLEVTAINVRDAGEIEKGIAAFADTANGGLIVTAGPGQLVHRDLIITLAARHRLPAVYFDRLFVASGGLISYGANLIDQHRRAAAYVDRILKGEKAGDLPVQAPDKYELAINLKTAKAMGLTMSPAVLARADEVIE
jgi:putative tryptophan/tyrosine transport system substrate-binding protein